MLMPEMNALELMAELSRSFLNVKVIAMSGVPPEEERGVTHGQAVG
jgi:CheY-like chemotaxis protein